MNFDKLMQKISEKDELKEERDDLIKERETLLKQSLEVRDLKVLDVIMDAVKEKSSLEKVDLLCQVIVTI